MSERNSQSPAPAGKRAAASISSKLDKKLLAYAAAAAGVLMAAPAQAEIVFTPTDVVIGPNGSYFLDMDGDGAGDIKIENRQFGQSATLYARAIGIGDGYMVATSFFGAVEALNSGFVVGPGRRFIGYATFTYGPVMANYCKPCVDKVQGPWANVSNKFMGIRFKINGQYHYGWARFTVTVNGNDISAHLTGYAYETTFGTFIRAGRRSGPKKDAQSVLQQEGSDAQAFLPAADDASASLGILARGAAAKDGR